MCEAGIVRQLTGIGRALPGAHQRGKQFTVRLLRQVGRGGQALGLGRTIGQGVRQLAFQCGHAGTVEQGERGALLPGLPQGTGLGDL